MQSRINPNYSLSVIKDSGLSHWMNSLATKYVLKISNKTESHERNFFAPMSDLAEVKPSEPIEDMIYTKGEEIIQKDLLTDPNEQEFTYMNGEFKGTIDTTI
jgi:5'(3')-deoxyribonucleotidase